MYDKITVGTFVLQKDIRLVNFRRINSVSPFLEGIESMADFSVNRKCLKCIGDEMTRPISNTDTPLMYVPMQYISDFVYSLLEKHQEKKEDVYDGIEYASTVDSDGYNLMLFNPEICKCLSVRNVQIKQIEYDY